MRRLLGLGVVVTMLLVLPGVRSSDAAVTFTVNRTTDADDEDIGDGLCDSNLNQANEQCTLRAAIQETNALAGADTIQLPVGTIKLDLAGVGENKSRSGDLDIRGGLTITGQSMGETLIEWEQDIDELPDRVFHIPLNSNVSIADLTIRKGAALGEDGGGILNLGNLTLTRVRLVQNRARSAFDTGGNGGGVANFRTLDVIDSVVESNRGEKDGGGIHNDSSATLLVQNSVIHDNIHLGRGAGIANDGTATIEDSEITQNNASLGGVGTGGGVLNGPSGTMTLLRSLVDDNAASLSGGGIANDGTLIIDRTQVSSNASVGLHGGGIANSGALTIVRSAVVSNVAGPSASPNPALGGGLFNEGGTVDITNTTISGNTARSHGGGIFNRDLASPARDGSVQLNNVTIAENTADSIDGDEVGGNGGGVFNALGGLVNFRNTIVAGNSDGSDTGALAHDCVGVMTSQDYNLIGKPAGCSFAGVTTHNRTNVNALLGPLQDNGGDTLTHEPLDGAVDSPALNAGNPARCTDTAGTVLTTDQRGSPRHRDFEPPGRPICDIGAFEKSAAD